VLYGVDRSTISRAVAEAHRFGLAPAMPPGPRLHTWADAFAYAAARGMKLRTGGSGI
jgi:hypothetical protein